MKLFAMTTVLALVSTISQASVGLQKNNALYEGTSCFISENYVGLGWNNELVDSRNEVILSGATKSFDDVASLIETTKNLNLKTYSASEFSAKIPAGSFAITSDGSYVKLEGKSTVAKKLLKIIENNCVVITE